MKFKFKKIASILAGTVLMGSTIAFAAAANYPDPFVKSGSADVAVVYGSMPGNEFDLLAVADITQNLQAKLAAQTASSSSTSSTVSTTGEVAPLFSGSTKLYVNDTLNAVKSSLTKTEMPTVLKDGAFSGNVDATYTQTLTLGPNPSFLYNKYPTTNDEPGFALSMSTSSSTPLYNATVTFNKAVNLTHADSVGQELNLFGQKFTIASATTGSSIVLLQSASKISLSSDAPTQEVTVGGKKYTVELVSASDTSATVKVTDENGVSDSKEINENSSKKIAGLTIAVTNADETNLKLTASIVAGSEKVTLTSGSAVAVGETDTAIDGTNVYFGGTPPALTKLVVSVAAPNSDNDAIKPGKSFVDPVFKTFKIDFPGLNIDDNSSLRENIQVRSSGDDKLAVSGLKDYNGDELSSFTFIYNTTSSLLLSDDNARNITIYEKQPVRRNGYVVAGNQNEGYLLKLTTVTNQTTGYSNDKVEYTDVFNSNNKFTATLTDEGTGTVTIGGKVYNVAYNGTSSDDGNWATLDYPDSASGEVILFPTIQLSKGAKLMFYKPLNLSLDSMNGVFGDGVTDITKIKIPDGDGYTDITAAIKIPDVAGLGNFTINGNVLNSTNTQANVTVGALSYNFVYGGDAIVNKTLVSINNPDGSGAITTPALILLEEKDDDSEYQAVVITPEVGINADDGMGVADIDYSNWVGTSAVTSPSNSRISKKTDLFGVIGTLDSGDSDQTQATVSYPDEQIYANIYAAANTAELSVSGGSSGSGTVKELGSVSFSDANVPTGKNLIVVGGSCVNKLAAELISGAGCGASWEQKTSVGAGSFLIQSFDRSGKVATLVAGYNAEDTRNAAKVLTSDMTIDLSAGKKYKSTSATAVAMVSGDSASA